MFLILTIFEIYNTATETFIVIFLYINHLIMRNINVRENVVKSRRFGFFVLEFRLHYLATMVMSTAQIDNKREETTFETSP